MKRKNAFLSAAIGAFIVAALTTIITTRSAAPPRAALAPLIPSEITRIATDEGSVTRTAPGRWSVHRVGFDREWLASTAAVRTALRAAADIASLEVTEDSPSRIPPDVLTFTDEHASQRTFAISGNPIGGKHTVVIDGTHAVRAPAELVARLTPGPLAWRDTALFPNAGPDVTRLLIRQPATATEPALEIDLVKAAGRWLIASPVQARASEEAMRSAVARVASSSIVRFIDDATDTPAMGLDEPAFVITVEAGDDARSIAFGASADAGGQQRFALAGRAALVADTSLLSELRLDPAAYTDRRLTPVAPADVHAIRVDDARAQRTLSGWSDAPFDAATLLAALTEDADSIVAFEPPSGWSERATITLENLAADPLDIIVVGADADGNPHARTQLPGGGPVYYTLPASFRLE